MDPSGYVYGLPLSDGGASVVVSGTLQVEVTEATSDTATSPSQKTVGTSAITLLPANANRKGFIIQNQGTTVVKLLLGSGVPDQNNYTMALPACGVNNDASSQPWCGPPGLIWTGAVQAISSASGGLVGVVELS